MANLEREIDRLFALPLDEFTSSRNALARRLKGEGETEGAEQVRSLAKPSVPAWTINQLARREKAMVKALLDAGARLRKAQERALAGSHSDALRTAQAEERQAELKVSGFDALTGLALSSRPSAAPRDELAQRRRRKAERERQRRRLEKNVRELENRAEAAEQKAERAEAAAAEARKAADDLRNAADAAAAELAEFNE